MIPQLIAASAKLNIGLKKIKCYSRYPFRPVGFNDWKIKHIHYFTMKPFRIAFAYRNKMCYLAISAFIEDYAIKYTINDISYGAGQY